MFHRSKRGAFTLIELLVVVAIIAILVSILMPSLSKSKDLARDASCTMNQRNIFMVIKLYANDYDQFLPYADRTHNRLMNLVGTAGAWDYVWPSGMTSVLPPRLQGYMDPFSPGWLCPGWPIDKPYVDESLPFAAWQLVVVGTPTDPAAGSVRNTPRNVGLGYEYAPYITVGYHGPENTKSREARINFDRVRYPATSRVTSCLPTQQASYTGRVGPHHQGTRWNIVWADGSLSTTRGIYANPLWGELYENNPGDWLRDP